jgi:hypothetical protein
MAPVICADKMTVHRTACNLCIVAAIVLVLGMASALGRPGPGTSQDSTAPADQGCVNQGADRRDFAPVVCWMQRQMSWKSDRPPHFALIGKPNGTSLGLAWPPYAVVNWADGDGRWRMFRIGFRYDRSWRGYIFPTIAAKRVSRPLRY